MTISYDTVQQLLGGVKDPEIPVLTIRDLGVLRDVKVEEDRVEVSITPTYSGCPAMKAIEDEIIDTLKEHGIGRVTVKTVYAPAWTTDWLTDEAKEKLRAYGIAPPEKTSMDKNILALHPKTVACPRCGSVHTELISAFGSTACKALYRCKDCKEPFDYFKCH